MPAIAAAARNSIAKSRSETASSEFAAGRSKPSAAAVIVAVDRERRAGERAGAERALVEPPPAIGKPAAVAPEHLDIGQQMMTERHRLRDLQMREAGHHRRRLCFSACVDQRRLQRHASGGRAGRSHRASTAGNRSRPDRCASARCAAARPAAPISSASRASILRWMSSCSMRNGNFPLSISRRIRSRPRAIAAPSSREMMRRDQHRAMRLRAGDVFGIKALVEIDRGIDRRMMSLGLRRNVRPRHRGEFRIAASH